MSKKKKRGALFYVCAIVFYPVTLVVLLVNLLKKKKKGGRSNVAGETIGGKPTLYNGGTNYGGTYKGRGRRQLYNIILPTHSKRAISKLSRAQIQAAAIQYTETHERIISDGLYHIQSSAKPEVFFKRLFSVGGVLHATAIIEKYYPIFNTNQKRQYKNFLKNAPATVNAFIDRYAHDTRREAKSRETEAARRSYVQKRYDALDGYNEYMTTESQNYFNGVFASLIAEFAP